MRKLLFTFTVLIFLLPFAAAIPNLDIEKIDRGSVIVSELDNPAVFDLIINNNGEDEHFEIYTLIGVSISPKGFFEIPSGKSKVEVKAWPSREIRKNPGFFNFEFNIRSTQSGILRDTLLIKIVLLEEIFEIESEPFRPSDLNAVIKLRNKENTHLENVEINLESTFFSSSKKVSLEPYGEINISIPIDHEKATSTPAGQYIITSTITVEGKEVTNEGIIQYLEEEGTYTEKSVKGLIIKKTYLKETNEGNTPVTVKLELQKDIFSRLFTTNSIEPSTIERSGFQVTYSWQKRLRPGEALEIKSTTNYTLPIVIIALIIIVALFAKIYSQTPLTLSKKVSLVRTKGGEFALKVNLRAKARKHIDDIQIIDSLPTMTKLYEKFGVKPDKIDKQTRRLFWDLKRLQKGEVRIFSYIIYSKLNIVGRFELPAATAIYLFNGKTQEVFSNRAYFASEKI